MAPGWPRCGAGCGDSGKHEMTWWQCCSGLDTVMAQLYRGQASVCVLWRSIESHTVVGASQNSREAMRLGLDFRYYCWRSHQMYTWLIHCSATQILL
jgi:hypothetical protein